MTSKCFDISSIQLGDTVDDGQVVYIIDDHTVVVEYKLPCEDLNGSISKLKLVRM